LEVLELNILLSEAPFEEQLRGPLLLLDWQTHMMQIEAAVPYHYHSGSAAVL
jgi:hypothetical protein